MKDYKLISVKDGKEYDSTMQFKGNPAWRLKNIELIEWTSGNKVFTVSIPKGSLINQCISPNRDFLVLIYDIQNTSYCKVYNTFNKTNKTISPPLLLNWESIISHKGSNSIVGEFVGIDNPYGQYKYLEVKNLMILKIADPKRMHRGKWTEHRIFNPETGDIGNLLFTDVSEDL